MHNFVELVVVCHFVNETPRRGFNNLRSRIIYRKYIYYLIEISPVVLYFTKDFLEEVSIKQNMPKNSMFVTTQR